MWASDRSTREAPALQGFAGRSGEDLFKLLCEVIVGRAEELERINGLSRVLWLLVCHGLHGIAQLPQVIGIQHADDLTRLRASASDWFASANLSFALAGSAGFGRSAAKSATPAAWPALVAAAFKNAGINGASKGPRNAKLPLFPKVLADLLPSGRRRQNAPL